MAVAAFCFLKKLSPGPGWVPVGHRRGTLPVGAIGQWARTWGLYRRAQSPFAPPPALATPMSACTSVGAGRRHARRLGQTSTKPALRPTKAAAACARSQCIWVRGAGASGRGPGPLGGASGRGPATCGGAPGAPDAWPQDIAFPAQVDHAGDSTPSPPSPADVMPIKEKAALINA